MVIAWSLGHIGLGQFKFRLCVCSSEFRKIRPAVYDRGMWSVLWERVPILFVQLENVEISRESRFRSLTCQTSYFARFHTIIGSSCASPNFMWWWCLKFVRKCSQYKFCNGWVDPSLDHWEYFGISTTFVKSITIVITFFVFCSIHA